MKLQTLSPDMRIQTCIIHAPSGAGKTSLAVTAPNPLLLDSNKGTMSVDDPAFAHVKRIDVDSMDDLDGAYDRLSGTHPKNNWSKRFLSVIFDDFGDMQGFILDELVEKAMAKDSRRDDTVEQREYGIMGNKLRRYIRKFKKLRTLNLIFITASAQDFDSGQYRPRLIGALKDDLPYFVDHTIFLKRTPKGKRIICLDETEDYYAKTRRKHLPEAHRKLPFNLDDTACLTNVFALLAAKPKTSTAPQRKGK